MAASEPSRREMQLFTGFYNRIDAIIMQENTKSEPFFKKINNLFTVPESDLKNQKTHSIEVGKSPNYLIFKLQSAPFMYLMATCMYNQFFDADKFSCESCRPAHHSFGLQEENCYPCNTLWMSSQQSEVERAIFEQNCTNGRNKSIGVIVGTCVLILIVGTICCCQNRAIAKKLRALEVQNIKAQKTAEQMEIAKRIGDILGAKANDEVEAASHKPKKTVRSAASPSRHNQTTERAETHENMFGGNDGLLRPLERAQPEY